MLGNPPTNSLEAQHVKIVDMFPHHKLCIQFSEEVHRYFPIVVRGDVKNHVPPIHPVVSDGWKSAPLNRNMWPTDLRDVIRPRQSKQ